MAKLDELTVTAAQVTTEEPPPPSVWEQLRPLMGLAVATAMVLPLGRMVVPLTRRALRGMR